MLRRSLAIAVLLAVATVPCLDAPQAAAASGCGSAVRGDLDGNGVADLVVGASRYNYPESGEHTEFDVVRYPSEQRLSLGVSDLDPDRAGVLERAAIGDLDADGCADVVFAADDATAPGAARLYVVPGSVDGLVLAQATRIDLSADLVQNVVVLPHTTGSQIAVTTRSDDGDQALHIVTLGDSFAATGLATITAASLGIKPAQNAGYGFGISLAASGRTIVVGNPRERLGKRYSVGAVHLFTATDAAPTTFRHSRITESSAHIPGRAVDGSSFGEAVDYLDGRLAIAAPDKQVVRKNNVANNAGQLFLLRWHETTRTYTFLRTVNQNSTGVAGTAEPWDRLGYQVLLARGLTSPDAYDLVAASREGIGAAQVAGSILVTNFDKGGSRTLTEASAGVPGDVGEEHWFGFQLTRRAGTTSDVLVAGAFDHEALCGDGEVVQTSGAPLATTTWEAVAPESEDVPCPSGAWPSSLAR
ncbi:MAG: VCBS repeat-containing protein [Propionicimonas sp.]|uniref:hypothetical protein n=1 Tax=Propionicimonas sp. TaxID=1955623 RepID=UPI003D107A05